MLATQDVWPSSTAHLTNEERLQRFREKAHIIDLQIMSLAQDAAELAASDAWDEDGSATAIDWIRFNGHMTSNAAAHLILARAQEGREPPASDAGDEDGSATAIDWIRFNGHMTSNAAADLIAVGKNLQRMPESHQAVYQGEIGYSHVKAMARTAAAVGTKFEEAPLLEQARENSPVKFYYICHHYRHAADRKGFEAEQAELVEDRKLFISTCEDGTVLLSGNFDPEGGAAILTQLKPLARKSGAHDDRRREKRNADALGELASGGGSRAQIQGTTSLR